MRGRALPFQGHRSLRDRRTTPYPGKALPRDMRPPASRLRRKSGVPGAEVAASFGQVASVGHL